MYPPATLVLQTKNVTSDLPGQGVHLPIGCFFRNYLASRLLSVIDFQPCHRFTHTPSSPKFRKKTLPLFLGGSGISKPAASLFKNVDTDRQAPARTRLYGYVRS